MKTLFEIGEKRGTGDIILCEWGNQYCCIAGFNVDINKVNWITYKTYDYLDTETVQAIVSEYGDSKEIVFSSAFPEFLLTPTIYSASEALYDLFPDHKASVAHTDVINEWQVQNQYLIPEAIHSALQREGTKVTYAHFFTSVLKNFNGISAEDQIQVQFSPNQFSVLVKKKGQLQLAQIYSYLAPLDVVYYLLKIIEELELSREETALIITGLIEEQSDLYKELYQYFMHIHFDTLPTAIIENDNHPSHFFTSLYNLSACVS